MRPPLAAMGFAHLYIDDSPKNIEAFAKADKPCIVFDNPTNRHLETQLRAMNWDDVYKLVRRSMVAAGFEPNNDAAAKKGPGKKKKR